MCLSTRTAWDDGADVAASFDHQPDCAHMACAAVRLRVMLFAERGNNLHHVHHIVWVDNLHDLCRL